MPVYKYLNCDRKDVLANLKIRISQPTALNDPLDCMPAIDEPSNIEAVIDSSLQRLNDISFQTGIAAEEIETRKKKLVEKCKRNGLSPQLNYYDVLKRTVGKEIGVLSLSKRPDNYPLWAYYACNHCGYVIAFDETHAFFNRFHQDPEGAGVLRDVDYRNDRAIVHFDEIQFRREWLFYKSTAWQGEDEVRMIKMLKDADEKLNGDIHLFSLPATAIQKVILGMKAPTNLINDLFQYANAKPELAHVQFERATMDPHYYQMAFKPLIRNA